MDLRTLSSEELKNNLKDGKITVAVYGMGHVGAPLLAAWLLAGARGIGVDIRKEVVELVNAGRSPVKEPGVEEVLARSLSDGRLKATTDGVSASKESDVKILAIPIYLRGKRADLSALESAGRSVGRGLKEGDLVILESSVPPRTTDKVLKKILEEESGLRAEKDFLLAYSPERIFEGRALKDIVESYPKIVGGIGPESLRVASSLYEVVCRKGVIRASNTTVAEFEKLAEGVYRDVNIALANELASLCRELGVDFEEVRALANSQPYCHLHRPGTGVGGMCIPYYPLFMNQVAEELGIDLFLTMTARRINLEAPQRIALLTKRLIDYLGLVNPRIAVLGLAFRGDVDDTRASPTYNLVSELMKLGLDRIVVHDPFVKKDVALEGWGIELTDDLEKALDADVVIISTDHTAYKKEASFFCRGRVKLLVDGRDVVRPSSDIRCTYVGVGRPIMKPAGD